MRGTDVHQEGLFSYLSPESRIPQRHPLRPVREMVDIALSELSGQLNRIDAPRTLDQCYVRFSSI